MIITAAETNSFFAAHGFSETQCASLSEIWTEYDAPGRFYHDRRHIIDMWNAIPNITLAEGLAVLFHDVVYDTARFDNEERSAEYFTKHLAKTGLPVSEAQAENTREYILATKAHRIPENARDAEGCKRILNADLNIFAADVARLTEYEIGIFKEYRRYDFRLYRMTRLDILRKLADGLRNDNLFLNSAALANGVEKCGTFLEMWRPHIGLYPGSFNPFHIGHLDVLVKAEAIFDKVILGIGKNPEKPDADISLPSSIADRQIYGYTGMLHEAVRELGYPTVVRGLRSSDDLSYEDNQYRWVAEFDPQIQFCIILSEKNLSHVSSSALRNIERFDAAKPVLDKYLVR